jgi:hypothetical protein
MHSIHILTALHITYLDATGRGASICDSVQHHKRALSKLNENVAYACPATIDEDIANAVFANAILSFFRAFITVGRMYDDTYYMVGW